MGAYNQKWPAVASTPLTANGSTTGLVTISSTLGFWSGQRVVLAGTSLVSGTYVVTEVLSPTTLVVAIPVNGGQNQDGKTNFSDISQYTTAATSTISAVIQNKNPNVPPRLAAVDAYEGEPVAAFRMKLVDQYGSDVGAFNSLAVQEPQAAAALQRLLFSLSTAAAGVTIGATNVFSSTGPATPILGLFNPLTSGKNAVIDSVQHNWNSGTAGAGGLVIAVLAAATISAATGTATLNKTTGLSGTSSGSLMKSFVNAAITGQAGACTLAEYIGGPDAGALAANSAQFFNYDTRGGIVIAPGSFAGVFAASVGTSPIVSASMQWREF